MWDQFVYVKSFLEESRLYEAHIFAAPEHKSCSFYYTRLLSYNWLPEIIRLYKLSTKSKGQRAVIGQMRCYAEGS